MSSDKHTAHLRRTTSLCIALMLSSLSVLLSLTTLATAQRWPRIEPEHAAHTRRDADFATATGLTPDQARTVFAQMRYPPHAPRARSVVSDTLPDGTRDIFALLDFDPIAECRIQGSSARECSELSGDHGVHSHIVLVQVSPSGQVTRTAVALAVGLTRRSPSLRRPTSLRLFSPAPGAARIAVIEGSHYASAGRTDEGAVEPPEYSHDLLVWDGRRERTFLVSVFSRDGELAEVVLDEATHRILVRSVRCGPGCPCLVSRDIAGEARQLAQRARRCPPTEREITLPAELRLVDDDLDARTPRLTREEALAARVPALVAQSGLTTAQAQQVVTARTTLVMPRFGRFVSHSSSDGTRDLYGIVETSVFESCVYGTHRLSVYDAVRLCAHENATRGEVLYVRLAADGTVATSTLLWIGLDGVAALHLAQDASGVFMAAEHRSVVNGPQGTFVTHFVHFARGGRPAGNALLTFAGEGSRVRDATQSYAGELVVRPAEPPFVTLSQRRVPCTVQCPCATVPTNAAEAHALVESRVAAEEPACRPVELPIAPMR